MINIIVFIFENILNNDNFFTVIENSREDFEDNINIEEVKKEKITLPANYMINIYENIFNSLKELLNNHKIKLILNNCWLKK